MQSYRDLIVWQKSIVLTKQVYAITAQFPVAEQYGLVSQMRRCAVSVPSNIAEGFARKSTRENQQFISIALGSVAELDTQLHITKELAYYKGSEITEAEALLVEVRKMLLVLRQRL